MNMEERAVAFTCNGSQLFGVLSVPAQPTGAAMATRGVIIVVGGPQYRAGSHRQFTLLARHLASSGIPVLRFDYRGMGDSEGAARSFEHIDDDIRAAVDCLFAEMPGLREVVLWGLCDGASASLFYAGGDVRVKGLVLLNPWARTEQGEARAYLRHYYARRLLDPELWRKILRGRFDFGGAMRSARQMASNSMKPSAAQAVTGHPEAHAGASLPDRLLDGLLRFRGRVLFIFSGNDLTAKEFLDVAGSTSAWRRAFTGARVQRRDLAEANHTFARSDWRVQVEEWTREWVRAW